MGYREVGSHEAAESQRPQLDVLRCEVSVFRNNTHPLCLEVCSLDGRFVAYGSSDYTVGILDAQTLAVSAQDGLHNAQS